MSLSLEDVEYYAVDADEDGRDESVMMVFGDQTLLCVSDNDGDGRADYAAVDVNLTKVVDFAVHREGDVVGIQRFDAEGLADYEGLGAADFSEQFPGWAGLLDVAFPGGVPDYGALNRILAVVDEELFDRWTKRRMPWREGGLYAIPGEDGKYGIVKVLKVDDVGVHIRRYSNRFQQRPDGIDESQLFMARYDERAAEEMGIGHLPISARSFAHWGAVFVQQSTVQPDELDGYEAWRESSGGYF